MILISAFILGFMGSLHCVGMCGPIVLATRLPNKSWQTKLIGGLLHNFGRIITYSTIGAAFGLLGKGLSMAGIQRFISIAVGIVMIISVLFPLLFKNIKLGNSISTKLFSVVKQQFQLFISNPTCRSVFMVGILNGLLPCGLVYMAVAGALATGSVSDGIIYMFLFGLGTTPLLLATALLGNIGTNSIRIKIAKVIPYVVVVVGVLFILRGANLGIPYISPAEKKLNPQEQKLEKKIHKGDCCKK